MKEKKAERKTVLKKELNSLFFKNVICYCVHGIHEIEWFNVEILIACLYPLSFELA